MHKHVIALIGAGALAFGGHHAVNQHKKFLADGVDERSGGRPHIHHLRVTPLTVGRHRR